VKLRHNELYLRNEIEKPDINRCKQASERHSAQAPGLCVLKITDNTLYLLLSWALNNRTEAYDGIIINGPIPRVLAPSVLRP